MKKKILIPLVLLIILVLGGIFTFNVDWKRCKVCGIQEYERSVFGIVIEAISERNYDELGTSAKWEAKHKKKCVHDWEIVNDEK